MSSSGALAGTIQVTGSGRAEAEPTVTRIAVTAHATTESMREAAKLAAEAAKAIVAAFEADGATVHSTGLQFQPEWRQEGQPQRYTARHSLVAVSTAVGSTGELVSKVTEAAGDLLSLDSITFEVAETQAMALAAQQAAFDDARAKAEHYAALAGRGLGAVVAISESPGFAAPMPRKVAFDAVAAMPAQPVVAGAVSAAASVTVTWALA